LLDLVIPHHAEFQHGSKPGNANIHRRYRRYDPSNHPLDSLKSLN
jgi:hypothetical protein